MPKRRLDNSKIIFRDTCDADDAELIVKLHRQGYLDLDPRFNGAFMDTFLSYVRDTLSTGNFSHPDSRIWFAYKDKEPVGCCALLSIGKDIGQLRWVVVTPASRGLGIGRQLMSNVFAHANSCRMTSIILYTIDDLEPSKTLYENLGFTISQSYETELWYGKGIEVVMSRATHQGDG